MSAARPVWREIWRDGHLRHGKRRGTYAQWAKLVDSKIALDRIAAPKK